MKAIIILWFVAIFGLAFVMKLGIDRLYETAYFNKLSPEKQEIVMEWLNSNDLQP